MLLHWKCRNLTTGHPGKSPYTFIYACIDEIHQLFIPGRGSQIRDVLIDSIGAIMGLIFINLIFMLKNRIKESYSKNVQ